MPIEGAVFSLKGISDYGNEINLTGISRSNGEILFSGLEPGVYILKETEVPEEYVLDPVERIVTVDRLGNTEISGLEIDEYGAFVVTNKENTTVTIIKKWVGGSADERYENNGTGGSGQDIPSGQGSDRRNTAGAPNETRDGNDDNKTPKLPDIVISSDIPVPYAVFGGGNEHSVLSTVTALENIRSFAPYSGSDESFAAYINDNTAIRIDDYSTSYKIYARYDSTTGAVCWWSDARRVYLSDDSHYLWYQLTNCTSIDVSGIDTSNVTDMSRMFKDCRAVTSLDLTSFNTSRTTTMLDMFYNCYELTSLDMSSFNTSRVSNMGRMFAECHAITEIDISNFDTSKVTATNAMFARCYALESMDLSMLDLSKTLSIKQMFLQDSKLKRVNMSTVTDMRAMFKDCTALKEVNKYVFSTTACKDMSYMFYGCKNLLSLSGMNFTTDVTENMSYMFCGCESLTSINMRSYHTQDVTSMKAMFKDCKSMTGLLISGFDVSAVTDMSEMFSGCEALTVLDLSRFDTSAVTDMSEMFSGCISLITIYAEDHVWNIQSLNASNGMFAECIVLKGGFGTEFDNEAIDGSMAYIDSEEQQGYLTKKTAAHTRVTYHVTDDNCEVEVQDDNTWVFTFTGLDPNTPFYVWEEEGYEGYTSSNPRDNYIQLQDNTAVIVNTKDGEEPEDPKYGNLTIEKSIEGDNIPGDELERSFIFTVELFDENAEALSGSVIFGGTAFRNGKATVMLRGGSSVQISGIPAGYSYKVTESAVDGWESSSENEEGSIEADNTAEAVFTNTWTKPEEQKVSFTLKKIVEGNMEFNDDSYSFSISLTGLKAGAAYSLSDGTVYSADTLGKAFISVRLSDGQSVSVQDIPAGAGYRVTEAGGDYTSSYSITDSNGLGKIRQSNDFVTLKERSLGTAQETADEGEDVLITYTNTKDVRQDISVKKTVVNSAQGSGETFSFVIDITGLSENETVYAEGIGVYHADAAGRLSAEFLLRDGETAVFRDLPVGAYYTVTETANSYNASFAIEDRNGGTKIVEAYKENDESETALSTSEETVNEGEDILITFTNRKEQYDVSVAKIVDISEGAIPYASYSKLKFALTINFSGLEADKSYTMLYTSASSTGVLKTGSFKSTAEGEAVIELKLTHGQICTMKDIPVNAVYKVTEQGYQGYLSSYIIKGNEAAAIIKSEDTAAAPNTKLSTAEETVDADEHDVKIEFTNKFSAVNYTLPNAGREQNAAGAVVISALMLISWLSLAYIRIRSRSK